ncbi:MAG: hypothetical protein ABSF69_27815 [Polyangiaceae bacterium]|jgi:hypothetical protein
MGGFVPYVVRKNDYLAKIAYKLGFDPDSVWNDASNDDLRKLRPDPNQLLAGDLLHIPDPGDNPPPVHTLNIGTSNTFVSPDPPTVTVNQTFEDGDADTYTRKAYTITELPEQTGLSTGDDGTATFTVPVSLDQVTLVFTDSGESWVIVVGGIDPVDSTSGMFKRLQNLHYIAVDESYDLDNQSNNIELLRQGLRRLQAASGLTSGASSLPPANGGDNSAADSEAPSVLETGGLSDDGTLDADTRTLLVNAHGC